MTRIALLVPLVLGFAVGRAAAQDLTYNFPRLTEILARLVGVSDLDVLNDPK